MDRAADTRKERGSALERAFAELLAEDYPLVEPRGSKGAVYDFASRNERRVIDLRVSLFGSRDLDAAVMHLARVVSAQPALERATLVAVLPRMSADRIGRDWGEAIAVLRPKTAQRLALVALASDREVLEPAGDAELGRLLALAREAVRRSADRRATGPVRSIWSAKDFDVWMALLDGWLRGEGAIPIGELVRKSGASHPTVRGTLARLREHGELHRASDRGATFSTFPRRSLGELVVLAGTFRDTRRFVDRSGRQADAAALLRRVLAKAPPKVSLGGVEAARHFTPDFDLHGLPRLDVTVHGRASLEWISAVDPALGEAGPDEPSAVLVVHRTERADARVEPASGRRVPYASPAEVLFDLYDLRLTTQAEDFVRTLRKKADDHG